MRVLIIKTSSMGGVVHTLPALTDARSANPSLMFDWVVEESLAEIPGWHPAVDQVIPVAIRRWRKHLLQTAGSTEWRQFKNRIRKQHYDLVIDCQGLLKSAWVGRLTKAPVAGFDKHSVREPVAAWFYRQKYPVDKHQHAVERIRQLFANALGYTLPASRGDYGIDRRTFLGSVTESANVVFAHECVKAEKQYPELYWRDLAQQLIKDGYRVRLPWKSEADRERAGRIAKDLDGAEVLPKLNLQGIMGVLAQASAVVTVDNGIGHLSAALDVPSLSLYGPSNPELVGSYGDNQVHLTAQQFSSPGDTDPTELNALSPDIVYQTLKSQLLAESKTVVMPVIE